MRCADPGSDGAKIPILSSSWVQFRWMAIYILPIIIVSGLIIENLHFSSSKKKYITILLILILLTQNLVKDKSWHFNDQKYDTRNVIDFSLKVKTTRISAIKGPAVLMNEFDSVMRFNNKNDMFFYSYSPISCYQPIFGYGLEKLITDKITFNSKLILENNTYILYSNKLDKKDGHFMFFNPSCFLFPKENNCLPGDTFKVSEKDELIKFTNYKKFDFQQNNFQIISNYISFFTFAGCFVYLVYSFFIFIYNLRKKY